MADEDTNADSEEQIEKRQEALDELTISELAYPHIVRQALEHARRRRPDPPPMPLQRWRCVGPRNVAGRIISLVQDPGNALTLYAGSAFGGLWRTQDGGDTWIHVEGTEFVTADGGRTWNEKGPADFNCPVGALAIHPARRDVIYVGTGAIKANHASGRGFYRVTMGPHDATAVFERLADAPAFAVPPASATDGQSLRYSRVEVDPEDKNLIWVGSQTGLWSCRITGGESAAVRPTFAWNRELPSAAAGAPALHSGALSATAFGSWPAYVTDLRVARDPRDAATIVVNLREVRRYLVIYAGLSGAGVFRGRYDRQTRLVVWDPAVLGVPDPHFPFERVLLALCRSQPNHLFAVFQFPPDPADETVASAVFATADHGDSWRVAGAMPAIENRQANYSMVLEVHPDNPSIVICGTVNLHLSVDGAGTWRPIMVSENYNIGDHAQHADQHAVLFDHQDRHKLWVGNDGGLSMARDLTATEAAPGFWRKRSHGIIVSQFQDVAVHPRAGLRFMSAGGLQDNGSWVSYGGLTWYYVGWADGGAIAIRADDPRQYLVTQYKVINFNTVRSRPSPGISRQLISPVVPEYPPGRRTMYVGVGRYPPVVPGSKGPFVGLAEQDPRVGHEGEAMAAWIAGGGAPVAVHLGKPPAPVVNAIALPPPASAAGEKGSALAFGTPAAGKVEGWIGTDRGHIFTSRDAPTPPAPPHADAWRAAAALPAPGGAIRNVTRFAVHPGDARMVAVASIPRFVPGVGFSSPVTLTISTAGPVGGAARFTFHTGALVESAPLPVTAVAALAGTDLVVAFSGGPFVVGNRWTIDTDNTVTAAGGAVANHVEVIARPHGRVHLTYDRGANWIDISAPAARPAAAFTADTDSLPPAPITSLRFDTGGGALTLFAGTLAGVYAATNLPLPAAAPAAVNAVWRPFNGPPDHPLPLTLVNDIEMIPGTRTLRIATFGRGIWECDLAGGSRPLLMIRQTLLENGNAPARVFPPAIPDDPRLPAQAMWLDHAHACDIRVDTAPFDFFDDRVDGAEFDDQLGVDEVVPRARQAVYLQVQNHGWDVARNVRVHLLFAPSPAAPFTTGAVAPAASMPAGIPDPTSFYTPPDFNPSAPSPWRRVASPRTIDALRPGEPHVVRFDWTPPAMLEVPEHVALVALCTSPDDPLPDPLVPPAVETMAQFILRERRAALRVVPVRPSVPASVFIRDGVDDDARLGGVTFVGRSPDIIVVQAEPQNPEDTFRDLLNTRPQDTIKAGVNHIYVRASNRGPVDVDVEVRVWAVAMDAVSAPSFAPASWTLLTPRADKPQLHKVVPAGTTRLLHVEWADPPEPPGDELKAYAIVAVLRSVDNDDPLPDTARITSVETFWSFFGEHFDSDNAALRVLRYEP